VLCTRWPARACTRLTWSANTFVQQRRTTAPPVLLMPTTCNRMPCCCLQVEALVFSSGGFAVTAAYSSMHRWVGDHIQQTLCGDTRHAVCAALPICLAQHGANMHRLSWAQALHRLGAVSFTLIHDFDNHGEFKQACVSSVLVSACEHALTGRAMIDFGTTREDQP